MPALQRLRKTPTHANQTLVSKQSQGASLLFLGAEEQLELATLVTPQCSCNHMKKALLSSQMPTRSVLYNKWKGYLWNVMLYPKVNSVQTDKETKFVEFRKRHLQIAKNVFNKSSESSFVFSCNCFFHLILSFSIPICLLSCFLETRINLFCNWFVKLALSMMFKSLNHFQSSTCFHWTCGFSPNLTLIFCLKGTLNMYLL